MNDMSVPSADQKLRVLPRETVSMHLKDGTRLDADVYRPDHPGTFPVLLQRQAYGRSIACTICYAHRPGTRRKAMSSSCRMCAAAAHRRRVPAGRKRNQRWCRSH